ncbi:hypothetical protein [uncultured Paraglaciecola sp.]|uniref:hypothetical protein n=1 Tax=uncultured Paraglaciecola sp. TaxID=1765024 RepID=UPI00260AFB0A|nr:hypothetical protein [uncultured Paraglaciecola sp.]
MKINNVILRSIYCCIVCCSLSKAAQADTFVIGVEDVSYYPYFDFSSGNTSFSKALFDQFAKDSGHQISYLPLPIKQFPKWLHQENIDFKFPDNVRWQAPNTPQKQKVHFSEGIVALTAGTLVLAKNQHKNEAFFRNIGTITGFYPTLWINQIEQGKVSIYEDASSKILVKHLVNGLVDGLDLDLAVAHDGLKKLGINEKLVINQNVATENYYYHLSTLRHPKVIKQFNQWLVKRRKFIDSLKAEFGILAVEPSKVAVL